jgi:hypothetical protein
LPDPNSQSVPDRVRKIPPVGDYLAGAGFGIAVVGVATLLLTPLLYYLLPLTLGAIALALAGGGMLRARRAGHGGFWLGLAGVVLGSIGLILGVVYAIIFRDALAGFGA